MESKDFPKMLLRCLLCSKINDPNKGFYEIDKKHMPKSNKTIKSVLKHLAKCIKEDFNFDYYSTVCGLCFEKLAKYDETMVQLLTHQKDLGQMLEKAIKRLNNGTDMESVDGEDNKFDIITEEHDHHDSESIKDEVASECSIKSDDDDQSDSNDMSEDSKKLSFQCTSCDDTFKSNRALQMHLKVHIDLVTCSVCGVACKDEEYLELHMNIHEGKTETECRYCPKKYSRRSHVIRHMQIHWDKKKFQCEKCGLRFSQTNLLYNHKMNHEAEEDPLICHVCQQVFKTKRTFKHHMIIHQEDRPMYPCEICGKVFTQKYTIKAHLKTHAEGFFALPNTSSKQKVSKKDTKRFPCIICDRILTTQELLDVHMTQEHDVINDELLISSIL